MNVSLIVNTPRIVEHVVTTELSVYGPNSAQCRRTGVTGEQKCGSVDGGGGGGGGGAFRMNSLH